MSCGEKPNPPVSLFAAALVGGIFAPVYAQKTEDRVEIVKRADAARDTKSWADAEKLYDRAIALDPKLTEAEINRELAKKKKAGG